MADVRPEETEMKLYRISQETNRGWDTFDSAIVAADTEEEARNTFPDPDMAGDNFWSLRMWAEPENVKVECIGEAAADVARGVVLASFNAG